MKKVLLGLVVAMMLLPSVSFADDRDFTIINGTGYPIKFIGVNPPGDDVWNENELNGVLADGSRVAVKFGKAEKGCNWNVKVTWADDNTSSIFRGLNLCTINSVTLKYDKNSDKASYTTD